MKRVLLAATLLVSTSGLINPGSAHADRYRHSSREERHYRRALRGQSDFSDGGGGLFQSPDCQNGNCPYRDQENSDEEDQQSYYPQVESQPETAQPETPLQIPTNALPQVGPPANTIPKVAAEISVKKNPLLPSVKVATPATVRAIRDRLLEEIQSKTAALAASTEMGEALFSDALCRQIVDEASKDPRINGALVEFADACKRVDWDAIYKTGSKLPLSPALRAKFSSACRVSRSLTELAEAVTQGSTEQVPELAGRVRLAIKSAVIGREAKSLVVAGLGHLADQAVVAHQINANADAETGSVVLPRGDEVTLIVDSHIPQYQVLQLRSGLFAIGSANEESISVRVGSLASGLGLPIGRGTPAADSAATKPSDEGKITLLNPPATRQTVNFKLDSTADSIDAGATKVHEGDSMLISFDRGESFGTATYTLAPGTYRFEIGKSGWGLRRVNYRVSIDNHANPREFHCVINNEQVSIPAGETMSCKSDTKLVVSFHDGQKGAARTKSLESGTFQVAVDATTNRWDLFPTEDATVADSN